ncbi:MAG TPA: family 10 glycosylhydrolase [Phnomibacter sp.]|nr:family 10 glycosylhydrolase [Phnomibacter sp.]
MKPHRLLLLTTFTILSAGLFAQRPEFRAAWVATVVNIDWPSSKNLSTDAQKQEFISLLDMHKRNGLNALVVQIRPVADAFYDSPFEPWSEYLTGTQGRAPSPYYDPLRFMIDETHKRGMEFHAWLNPYRAVFNTRTSSVASSHPTRKFPEWFVDYGDASNTTRYFDPGIPEARNFVTNIVRDIVKRYDVDGIHMDDYFYPYPVGGKPFPDSKSYARYGNGMARDAWRRSNCDSIIVMIHRAIREEKPWVKFGISPFGVWRNASKDPNGSRTDAGITNYDHLYADILLWLEKGWIDYVAPQLYWSIGHPKADFMTLLEWWSQRTYGKHCYIGVSVFETNTNYVRKDPTQLRRMMEAIRKTPNVHGAIFYKSSSFKQNPNGFNDFLRNDHYKEAAPVPVMDWLPGRQ